MKTGYTHWSVLIDRSGSMSSIKTAVIEGFNQSVKEQTDEPGELTVSLVQFDDYYDEEVVENFGPFNRSRPMKLQFNQINDFAAVSEVKLLNESNFIPRGNTPLNDAVARLIEETGKRLAAMPESQRPEKVIVTIMTDGYENASKSHSKESIRKMIEHQEKTYGWKFLYVGANQDSFQEAATRGMSSAMNYEATEKGAKSAFFSNSKSLSKMRSMSNESFGAYSATVDMAATYKEEMAKPEEPKTPPTPNTTK
jgi:hypothetical protein